ncbi:hypothetical protein [Rhizobium fabae]|uniref:Uncharacterized protein n=1 Tax=Rhizobium fabae TaxID=573179 RepID=A0A7W6FLW1_9HYPH|nr:hypothetical protein [Rhizobium fabae]MBB3918334.1 hypothetical protein [Rhizobium fabae]RUM08572.1 hypothetical protein EFB14_27975 [Rhizobium fabae]
MQRFTDLSEIDWIKHSIAKASPETLGTVSRLIPPIYPAYVKIFHPLYEDLTVEDMQLTWHEHALRFSQPTSGEQQDLEATILRSATMVYGGPTSDSQLFPLRWRALCSALGIPYAPTLSVWSFTRHFVGGSWPKRLIGPDEGTLAPIERDALISVLRRRTPAGSCFFHFWLLATEDMEDLVFRGTLDEAAAFPDDVPGVRLTPTHWFPEDRSWLVCSDYDLTFTLVGGSESLVQDLMDSQVLECVRVHPGTRIDSHADVPEPSG